jgi:hypothetical protein
MQWPMQNRVARQTDAFRKAMDRIGLDPLALVQLDRGRSFAEAVRRCLVCGNSSECRRWLETEKRPTDSPPPFCANAIDFRRAREASGGTR